MIYRRPLAIGAIIDLAEFIGQRSPQAADRFLDATEETFAQLEQFPGMGHFYTTDEPRLEGIRVWAVKGFPNHLIFYRSREYGIEIIHVLHGARDLKAALNDV